MSELVRISDAVTIILGDCREVLPVECEAVVCDPPYGLSFMGKKWDYDVPPVETWEACLRSLKPGGHLLAFAGTRTQHRMAVNIEDAGFEIRDMIAWVYGSGFPKSLDVSKAIDKAAGAEREVIGTIARPNSFDDKGEGGGGWKAQCVRLTAPATPAARQWNGWGTALKPALEPITMARKPLDGTVAENVLAHGTGAINVDGCRVGTTVETWPSSRSYAPGQLQPGGRGETCPTGPAPAGRWPANLIHDGSDEVKALFPETESPSGTTMRAYGAYKTVGGEKNHRPCHDSGMTRNTVNGFGDSGSAARFFYCAKADKADRDDGNNHPTVKPVDLMRYLVTLVCREGGTVLDPFMGSGTTGIACIRTGRKFIGIERDARYFEIARQRLLRESAQPDLFFSLSPLPSA